MKKRPSRTIGVKKLRRHLPIGAMQVATIETKVNNYSKRRKFIHNMYMASFVACIGVLILHLVPFTN